MYDTLFCFVFLNSASLSIVGVSDGTKTRSRKGYSVRGGLWYRTSQSIGCQTSLLLLADIQSKSI